MLNFRLTGHGLATGKPLEYIVGVLPRFIDPDSVLNARSQMDVAYQHGCGWQPSERFALDPASKALICTDEVRLPPLAVARLRDETIYVYDRAWVAVVQPDGSCEINRLV
jgi:hypothetical protein